LVGLIGYLVNEKAVIEYLQARAQALCDMGLLDEQGMQAILQGRLQKRDSAYEVCIHVFLALCC